MEFFIHHNVTVILMMLSWSINVVRIGTLVLCIHDPVDYILAVSNIVYRVKVRVVMLSWSVNVACIGMLVLSIHDPVDYIITVTNRIGFGGPSEKTSVLINFLMQNTMLTHVRWFSPGTPAFSTTKTDHHDIAEILLKVALKLQK